MAYDSASFFLLCNVRGKSDPVKARKPSGTDFLKRYQINGPHPLLIYEITMKTNLEQWRWFIYIFFFLIL